MPPEDHALLSPSASHQWLNCPPSVRLTAEMPDTAGAAAEEGRVAHALGELKLRRKFGNLSSRAYNAALKKIQADRDALEAKHGTGAIGTWAEMDSATNEYLDLINEISLSFKELPHVAIEQRVDLRPEIPECYGTADCTLIGDRILHIVDLKYGKGVPVPAEGNSQMRIYAYGALVRYELALPVDRVRMTIFQPRNGGIDNAEEMSAEELRTWMLEHVKPRAVQAVSGSGECQAGEWCRFCKIRAICRARSDANLQLEGFQKKLPPMLSNDEVGDALRRSRDLADWLSDLEKYALSALLSGAEIAGWKAVEGRGSTSFTPNYDACAEIMMAAGYDRALLYREEPETLKTLDTVFHGRKKLKDLLGDHLTSTPGKPALAQSSDKRPALTARPTAEEDFSAMT